MENLSNVFQTSSSFGPPIDFVDVSYSLGIAILFCLIMFITFKYSRPKIVYDANFNTTLVVIALVVTIIMNLIQTNVALSIGMMGSLSIIRFRTNTKDPRDLGFVFWAMAIGLASATHNFLIGLIGSIVVSIFLFITGDRNINSNRLLLVIRGHQANIPLITDTVLRLTGTSKIKAQNLLPESFELVYEIKTKKQNEQGLVNKLMSIDGIDSVNVLAPSAEIN